MTKEKLIKICMIIAWVCLIVVLISILMNKEKKLLDIILGLVCLSNAISISIVNRLLKRK
ncbi:MAG: hypothetical protein QME35_08375 [Thermoanaerobacteraceae bacterium]|nr:hypothetical protein [Thermoanaerobacteraceae bacterium]